MAKKLPVVYALKYGNYIQSPHDEKNIPVNFICNKWFINRYSDVNDETIELF